MRISNFSIILTFKTFFVICTSEKKIEKFFQNIFSRSNENEHKTMSESLSNWNKETFFYYNSLRPNMLNKFMR